MLDMFHAYRKAPYIRVQAHPVQNKHRSRSMVILSSDKSFPYSVTVIPSSLWIAHTIITEGGGFILNVY